MLIYQPLLGKRARAPLAWVPLWVYKALSKRANLNIWSVFQTGALWSINRERRNEIQNGGGVILLVRERMAKKTSLYLGFTIK